jgi:hypothetical protein
MSVLHEFGRRAILWTHMLGRLGHDIAEASQEGHGLCLQGVARVCRSCAQTRRCQAWLDRTDEPFGYRRFCPNATYFDRLERD